MHPIAVGRSRRSLVLPVPAAARRAPPSRAPLARRGANAAILHTSRLPATLRRRVPLRASSPGKPPISLPARPRALP